MEPQSCLLPVLNAGDYWLMSAAFAQTLEFGNHRMTPAETYRANAAEQRAAAEKATLTNRRDMHERSAEIWEAMAKQTDATAARAVVNAAAKAAS